jgi:hypothetical protein
LTAPVDTVAKGAPLAGLVLNVTVFSFQGEVTSENCKDPPVVTWFWKTRKYAALTTAFVG